MGHVYTGHVHLIKFVNLMESANIFHAHLIKFVNLTEFVDRLNVPPIQHMMKELTNVYQQFVGKMQLYCQMGNASPVREEH